MLITSRSAAEYHAMFDLTTADLAGRLVLDCCAGGSGFAACTDAQVIAVEPAYALGRADLAERIRASLPGTDQEVSENAGSFDWSWFGTRDRRAALRTAAATRFLDDISARPGRYIAGALPHLPLATASFDLVLCSHLLFTWSDRLDAYWHRQALAELIRVSRAEVRIFPLVNQGAGEPVPFLEELRTDLHAAGYRSRLRAVPFRFQHNAHEMLTIRPGGTQDGPAPAWPAAPAGGVHRQAGHPVDDRGTAA